ncbi:unnamed protein product, partial [Scytosiphon promiscuus]
APSGTSPGPVDIRSVILQWRCMEPEKWFIDREGSQKEHSTESDWEEEGQRETQRLLEGAALESPEVNQQGANETGASSRQREASSHNSVDDLLRRIARDVSARQARVRSDSSGRDRHDRNSSRNDNSSSSNSHRLTSSNAERNGNGNNGGRDCQQSHQAGPPSQDSSRRSRWGPITGQHRQSTGGELGALARRGSRDGGEGEEAAAPSATAVSIAEADPFTESMWEDTSCRQVLQAMYFTPDSAVPAGSTEEYKELEEFVPKFLARRERAKEAASRRAAATPTDSNSKTQHGAVSIPTTTAAAAAAAVQPKPLPPALSGLPRSFHKRYLMNFTVLSPEQQRAAQEAASAQQRREAEESAHRRGGDRRG